MENYIAKHKTKIVFGALLGVLFVMVAFLYFYGGFKDIDSFFFWIKLKIEYILGNSKFGH